jgi:hypothetical protein
VWCSRSTFATTTVDERTVPANFAHHNRIHPVAGLNHERIKRHTVLGGLINEYERVA